MIHSRSLTATLLNTTEESNNLYDCVASSDLMKFEWELGKFMH